jgi:uncharacterized protein (TIGR02284 family)
MAEMTADPSQIVKHLNSLIELDYDAVEAYEAAIARLSGVSDKTQLSRFLADHQRHIADLTPLVQEFGGTPATEADIKAVLTKGKVVLGGLVGDRSVLEAMRSNEETTTRVYQKAVSEVGIPMRVREVLERNYSDETRHLAWLEQRLAVESQSSSDRVR